MDVSVRHVDSGHSCVIGVPEGGTVVSLKADALEEMFAGSINADREAAGLAAHIEGCEEELDDTDRVADTGLEDGGAVRLVRRWPHVKAPVDYVGMHHDGAVECITLSRCGALCSVNRKSDHVTVFDTRTADEVANLKHGEELIWHTAFSVCGTWLATCSGDGTICVWLTATWELVWRLKEHDTGVWSAAWTHCGRLVSGDNGGQVCVWDLEGTPSATVLEGHRRAVCGVAVSTTRIFTGSTDHTIRVYDISTLTHTDILSEDAGGVYSIALTNDDQHLVSCFADKSLKVWCTTTLTCIRTASASGGLYLLAVSQPGDVVAVSFSDHTTLFKLSTLQCLGQVDSKGGGVALSPCGRWVFTSSDHSVKVHAVRDVPGEDST